MKLRYLNTAFAGIIIGGTLLVSCTKTSNDDTFPPGDVPLTAGGYSSSTEIAPKNLIAYWNFNAESILDSVSNTTGTNAGMTYTAGLKGKALTGNPDGSKKAYATTIPSEAIKTMTQYTVSCWVNSPLNSAGAAGIFSLSNTQGFWGNINMFFENGGSITDAPFKSLITDNGAEYDNGITRVSNGFNNWMSYVNTYDGAGTFKSYINGSLVASRTFTGGPIRFLNVGPIVFGALQFMTVPSTTTGASAQSWAGYLPGKIDEVRVYNKALTATEVSALATLERQGR